MPVKLLRLILTPRCIEKLAVPLALSVFICGYSVWLGVDVSWDLLNYHLYNPFALLYKSDGTDIAVAQLQSYFSPVYDVVLRAIRSVLSEWPKTLCAVLAIPSAIGAVLVFRIGLILVAEVQSSNWWTARWVGVAIVTLYGLTGAAGLSTTGSSMSEMPSTCFLLGSLFIILNYMREGRVSTSACFCAGTLGGAALGIKLTAAPFLLALLPSVLIAMSGSHRERLKFASVYSIAAAIGLFVTSGPWFLHVYLETGNPVFPLFNQIFRSPLYPEVSMTDDRFKPHGLLQTLFYPAYWAFRSSASVAEVGVRDPRVLLNLFFACLIVCVSIRDRVKRVSETMDDGVRRGLLIAVFLLFGYVSWEKQFSILRYLVPIEMIGGLLVIVLIERFAIRLNTRLMSALVASTALVFSFTIYPNWGRIPQDTPVYQAVLPPLGGDDMVLLLSGEPMAFIATFADPSTRFIGVNNNLVTPGSRSGLAMRVEQAVRDHGGRLWGLEVAREADLSNPTLDYYGIRRSEWCEMINSNFRRQVRICKLSRS